MICRHRINLLIFQNYVNIVSSKNFHLSHLNRLRKPSSARNALNSSFEDVQEHTISGVFHDPPKNVNVCKNFYGIESDEGVINVEELGKAEKSVEGLKKATLNQSMSEFRSFNFGAIRLDNENRPSYAPPRSFKRLKRKLNTRDKIIEQSNDHVTVGNLESKINNVYPLNVNSNILVTEDIFQPNSLHSEAKKISSTEKPDSNVSSRDISSLPESNLHDIKRDTARSFKSNNSPAIDSFKQNEFAHQASPKVSESFIDKYYFTKNCSEEFDSHTEKSTENLVDQKFGEGNRNMSVRLSKTDVHNIKGDTLVTGSCKQNQFVNQDSPKVSESFIDKFYFAEKYSEDSLPQAENSDSFIEGQYFKESNRTVSESDYKTVSVSQTKEYHTPKNLRDNYVQIKELLKPDAVKEKCVLKSPQNDNKSYNYENDMKVHHNSNVQDLTKKVDGLTSTINTVTHAKINLRKKGLQNKSTKDKFSSITVSGKKTDLAKETKKDPQVLSQNEILNKKVSSEQTLNSAEKSQDKKSFSENKIETAFDFVKKLKENNTKLLSDDIKKGISAKKERKVDSKGFRILKHQVPSLEYFTRDEMLDLLKGSILYTDEDVVVLNKPYNLVMHESSTSQDLACLSRYLDDLAKLLDPSTNSPKLFTVHRLDKETTGCLLLARNEVSAERLKSLFAQRKIAKTYWIVTINIPDPMEGIIDMPISEGKIDKRSRMVLHPNLPNDIPYVSHSKAGKQAITQYSVIAASGNAALVEVKPETGIKHQIRVHFGFGLGCPILGDHKYSHLDKLVPQKLPSDLLQKLKVRQSKVRHIPLHIHSKHIFIPQYSNDRNLFVAAPLPRHMSENLQSLKFKKNKS